MPVFAEYYTFKNSNINKCHNIPVFVLAGIFKAGVFISDYVSNGHL